MEGSFFLLLLGFSCTLSWSQSVTRSNIQGIRLSGGSNEYSGNVQLLYNNTWGTICDSRWSISAARVACRMLGFAGASCATLNAYFGRTRPPSVPIWINSVRCRGYETSLDQCYFSGWGIGSHYCYSHSDDAGVVCFNETLSDELDVTLVNTTTRSITITWPKVNSTLSINRQRYRIEYNTSENTYATYIYPSTSSSGPYFAKLSNVQKATTYTISVRWEAVLAGCAFYSGYNPISPSSTPITATTNSTARPSNFEVRLVPAISGLNYTGRVEVKYNNSGWGTVCDYYFAISDANIICNMLGYNGAVCAISNARFGRGSGPIWLNRLTCVGAEILDDCSYRNYSDGSSLSRQSCRSSHSDDAGVICRPEPEDFLAAPEGFNVSVNPSRSSTLIFSWKPYTFPYYLRSSFYYFYSSRGFRIDYTRSDRSSSRYTLYPSYLSTTYSLTRIPLGVTVNATITPRGRFRQYSCYNYIDGATSDTISVTTVERPPSTAPLNFHVSVVDCSTIMAEWDLPGFDTRNGIIRGFKLFYKERLTGDETTIDLPANVTEYIIEDLKASTSYVVSVLAYTVGDGPRSIHLIATTNSEKICQTDIIDFFGINGNELDRYTVYSYTSRRPVKVFCGSKLPNVSIDWFYSNGTKVGIKRSHIREGHYENGTSELTIGHNGRVITACDGGTYICRANQTRNNYIQQRTFKLIYYRNPPTPVRPVVLKVTSSSITLKWPKYECDGGHDLQYFSIRIGYHTSTFYSRTIYRYINNIDATLSNYTATGLVASTSYFVSIKAVGKDSTQSSYSPTSTVLTLPPAPTPPGSVSVKLITPNTILVNWTRPTTINAEIAYYTVYATPFISRTSFTPRTKRQADSLQVASKNFSRTATSGNITLPHIGLEYYVQVSVTVIDTTTRINRESLFSALGPNSTIFVPVQGLPIPNNVRISGSSNTSLTVSWTAPASNGDTIKGYLVEYSGTVDGRSPGGTVLSYMHEGNSTVSSDDTSFVIQPLAPQTNYLIKVSTLTNRGEGMQVTVTGTTANANSVFERHVYFQVRFGPVFSCSAFRKDLKGQEDIVKRQIFGYLKIYCNCGFTNANIISNFFLCGQQDHEIIYRAHIIGNSDYSAIDLVEILQNWVQSGFAYVTLNNFRMQLDPTCPTRLDTLEDFECSGGSFKSTTSKTKPEVTEYKPTQSPKENGKENDAGKSQQNVQVQNQSSGITASALGGMFVGLIIALLLVILIAVIIVIALWKLQKSKSERNNGGRSKANTHRDSMMRFADLENSGDNFGEEKNPDVFN